MLFCFSSHAREEEYQFLTEEIDDDEPELIAGVDDTVESHENAINQELATFNGVRKLGLEISVSDESPKSVHNNNNNNTLHSPNTPRTFLKNSMAKAFSIDSPTSDFVHHTSHHQKNKLSKLGPAASFLRRNLSQTFARTNSATKGTEHLQKEALRKSNEANSNTNNQESQRYIRLPSSNSFRKSTSPSSSPTPVAPSWLVSSKSEEFAGRKSPVSATFASSSPRPDSPPSLVPRSANNPPPRPKTSKPVRSVSSVSDDARLHHSNMRRLTPLSKNCNSASSSTCNSDASSGQQQQQQQQQPSQESSSKSSQSNSASSSSQQSQQSSSNTSSTPTSTPSSSSQQFINKPPRGWLHPDQLLTDSTGATYSVRYIGFLGVNTSMKTLDFDTRSVIAKECINRVCEAAGLKTPDKNHKPNKRIDRMLADKPNLDNAGVDVTLSITSAYLNMTAVDTGKSLAKHEMPNISFASGGDTDTLDFAAYVAKDATHGRACFVLECDGGRAQDVITTIGQAFELRFKEFLKRSTERFEGFNGNNNNNNQLPATIRSDDREYYNDLPGKMPPEPDKTPLAAPRKVPATVLKTSEMNLIDLTEDAAATVPSSQASAGGDAQYVNCGNTATNDDLKPTAKDPFDMQPFTNALVENDAGQRVPPVGAPSEPSNGASNNESSVDFVSNDHLDKEPWFHGPISRKEAESLVQKDGDFLVRESQSTTGQYVLTGMQNGGRKHLLLVDPEGIVRTKDKTFESVSHLINYHRKNNLPIISSESALILKNPILTNKS